LVKNHDARKEVPAALSVKKKWGYISAQKLQREGSKSFNVSISLQTKAMRSYIRVPGTGKYPPSSGKLNRSWRKSRSAEGGLGYSMSSRKKLGYISVHKLETER